MKRHGWIALLSTAGIGFLLGQQAGTVTQRFPQFENNDVKVWRTVIMPGAPLTLHRHDHARVIVALRGGTIRIAEQNGPTEQQVWETGKAYWLTANAPNKVHTDANAGTEPIEVMVVELKNQ